MKIMDEELKPSCAYHKINTFHSEQRYTKKGTGKSMKMHCMYSSMAKGTYPAKAMLNSKKKSVKFIALAIVELHKSEGIRQLVSQSVTRKFR